VSLVELSYQMLESDKESRKRSTIVILEIFSSPCIRRHYQ